ncbi:MAG: hypothetical protein ACQEWV_03075 [Bacillota bacterium]
MPWIEKYEHGGDLLTARKYFYQGVASQHTKMGERNRSIDANDNLLTLQIMKVHQLLVF